MASGVPLAMRRRLTRATSSLGRQAEHHHLVGRRRDRGRGRAMSSRTRHAAPRHVLGERGQPRQRLLDALDARRDEGAGAMALHQHAAPDQILHRLAHGDARDVGLDGDVALGGQRVAGPDHAARRPRPRCSSSAAGRAARRSAARRGRSAKMRSAASAIGRAPSAEAAAPPWPPRRPARPAAARCSIAR